MNIEDIPSLVGGPTILSVGTLFEIVGDVKGALLLLASKKTILGLADMIQGRRVGSTKFLNDMDKDAIKEIGNILVGAYMTALAELSGLNLLESVPKLEINNVYSIIKDVIKEYDHEVKYTLVIETRMKIKKEGFTEDIIIILGHEEFGKLFHAMVKKMERC
jgi:chemotaxis protein CheC